MLNFLTSNELTRNPWRDLCFAAALLVGGLLATPALAVESLLLTTVQGDTTHQDQMAAVRSNVSEDQPLATGGDGGCSVLVDSNAVVELCGSTRVSFERNADKGNRIVNVEAGQLRLVVEPREPGERIEIHTPAAIATIMGTVVYVSVDPVTGATTISSSQSNVNIRAKDETEADATMIGANEQLTLVPGQRKGEKKLLSAEEIGDLGGCLLDFHNIAVELDRLPNQSRSVSRVAQVDAGIATLPPVMIAGPAGTLPTGPTNAPPAPPFTPLVGAPTPMPVTMDPPAPCGAGNPLGGVHCGP